MHRIDGMGWANLLAAIPLMITVLAHNEFFD